MISNRESTDSCSSLLAFQLLQPLLQVGRAFSVSRTRRSEAGKTPFRRDKGLGHSLLRRNKLQDQLTAVSPLLSSQIGLHALEAEVDEVDEVDAMFF